MIQARHVAGIPHAMRLGLGVSRSLELLRKCDTVQFMLLVQYSDAPTPPTRVSVVSSILMQEPSVGKKKSIEIQNPKSKIQTPNSNIFSLDFGCLSFGTLLRGAEGCPAEKVLPDDSITAAGCTAT